MTNAVICSTYHEVDGLALMEGESEEGEVVVVVPYEVDEVDEVEERSAMLRQRRRRRRVRVMATVRWLMALQ